MSILG